MQSSLQRALRNLLEGKREATQEGLGQVAEHIATAVRLIDVTHKLLAQEMAAAMREVL